VQHLYRKPAWNNLLSSAVKANNVHTEPIIERQVDSALVGERRLVQSSKVLRHKVETRSISWMYRNNTKIHTIPTEHLKLKNYKQCIILFIKIGVFFIFLKLSTFLHIVSITWQETLLNFCDSNSWGINEARKGKLTFFLLKYVMALSNSLRFSVAIS